MRLNNTPPANPAEIGTGQDIPLTSDAASQQSHAVAGWCDGYLLPGGEPVNIVGNTDSTLSSTKEREAYRAAGTQDEWLDKIAIYARNNSRLYLMLGAAFGAPLLSWARLNGAIIHLYGGNHDVQNAVQRIGQSVWGHGHKAFVSGNASRSALEQAALRRNDGLLSISGEIDASNARNLIPLITGKVHEHGTRAGVRCGGNALRLFVTSMGDIRWEDLLGTGSGAGQNIPVISVPHWLKRPAVFADDTAFVDWAQESCNHYYGTVGRIYIQQLLANKTHWQQFAVRDFATCYNFLSDVPPGKEQIARIFAVMMTGLKLAIRFELFWGDEFDVMCQIMECCYDALEVVAPLTDAKNESGECHE